MEIELAIIILKYGVLFPSSMKLRKPWWKEMHIFETMQFFSKELKRLEKLILLLVTEQKLMHNAIYLMSQHGLSTFHFWCIYFLNAPQNGEFLWF